MVEKLITSNQFKLLYDLAEDYVFFMRKTGDTFVYQYVNEKSNEIFEECPLGRTLEQCLDEFSYKTIIENYNRAIHMKKSVFYQDHFSLCNESYVNETTAIPIFDGGIEYILATTREVSRTQEMKDATYILESYKKGINDAALVAMTNKDGIIEMVNNVFLSTSHFEEHELIGRTFRMIDSNYHNASFFEDMWNTIKSGKIWRGQIRNRTENGSFYWVNANIVPIKNENGDIDKYLTIQFDITEKNRVLDELRNIERTFELITDYSNDLIAITDEEGYVLYSSPSHESVLHYEKEELLGTYYFQLVSDENFDLSNDVSFPNVHENKVFRTELLMKSKHQDIIWTDTSVTTVQRDVDGEQEKWYVIVSREITEKKALEERLIHMAYHDSLTGLCNRRSLHDSVSRNIESVSDSYPNFALIYIDGDDFKSVNDQFGHDVGDQFLFKFGECMQKAVDYEHTIYRVGGDEFIMIVEQIDDYVNGISNKVEKAIMDLRNELQIGWMINDHLFTPTSSIGISVYPNDGKTVDELVDRADQALYTAKSYGKNNYIYSSVLTR